MENMTSTFNRPYQARIYDTVGRMRKDRTLRRGDYVSTQGYYEPGDGGYADYVIRESSDEEDGGSVISLGRSGLQAHLVHHGTINIKQFGAYGDETHAAETTRAIQNAVNAVPQDGRVYIPRGTYLISEGINISPPRIDNPMYTKIIEVYGDGIASVIKAGSSLDKVLFSPTTADQVIKEKSRGVPTRHKFHDFQIDGNGIGNYGFYAEAIAHVLFERVRVLQTKEAGITTGYGWCNRFYDCEISYNDGDGFRSVVGANNGNTYQGCMVFANGGIGFNLCGGCSVTIRNCGIEQNKKAGIFAGAICALSIVENSFEANAETVIGIDGTSHQHDIILNGTYSTETLTYSPDANNNIELPGTIDISDNYVRVTRNFQPDLQPDDGAVPASFVYAPGVAGGDIKNNHLSGKDGYSVPLLMTSNDDSSHWTQRLTISGNYGFNADIYPVMV